MKPIFLSLLFLFNFPFQASGNDDSGTFSNTEIITAETIRNSGVTRVGDILRLADGLHLNSTDGYTWRISPNSLSSFQRQNWMVMLDGQKIELRAFDLINLNILATVIEQIDFVEIVNLPQIHEGEFADKGLIHIHTSKPQQGFSIGGHAATGSETKDPGPYINTKFATPNVDRTGTDSSATLDFAVKNWYVRTGLMTQAHSFTDLAMVRRNQHIHATDDFIELGSTLSFLKAGLETSYGSHELLASYADADRYFLFFKPAGREIPVDYITGHIGVNGDVSISENFGLTYRLKYGRLQLNKFPNTLDFDFDWKSSHFYANLEANFGSDLYKSKIGVGFDRTGLDTGYPLENNAVDIGKVYGTLHYNLADGVVQGLHVLVSLSRGKVGIKSALTNTWKMNSRHQLRAILSLSQRLFEEDNSLWYWSQRGYDLLKAHNINYAIMGHIDKRGQFTADVIWEYRLNRKLILELGSAYRFFDDLYLERQEFDFHPEHCTFSSPIQIYANQSGDVLGGRVGLKYRAFAQLDGRFSYSYRTEISGDDVFLDVWKSIPKHRASYRLTYTPVQNFSIWGMASYLSESNWRDYQHIDGKTCELGRVQVRYASRVKSAAILDLQIRKWFWRRQLQASLLFRNVWDSNYRYHPIGVSFDLGFYVQLKGFFSVSF